MSRKLEQLQRTACAASDASELSRFKFGDAGSYDPLAPAFDRFTEQLSAPLADRLIELARLTPSEHVLDVGTGTGVVALRAAEKVAPNGRVTALDLSDGMLNTARAKNAARAPDSQVQFCKMDAEMLGFEAGSFDVVLSLFALMHFPDPLTALREMHRVVRPGGRVVIAVGSGPPLLSLTGLLRRFARLPDVVKSMQGRRLTAPQFLNALVEKYLPDAHEPEESSVARRSGSRSGIVRALVRQAGFVAMRSCWQGHVGALESAQAFWDLQATFSTVARKRLAKALPEQGSALQAEFFETCRKVQERGGRLIFPQAAVFVVARRG